MYQYLFGPVPSRRLGYSLGVDLVHAKTCDYDCLFCQLGGTTLLTLERKAYVPVSDVIHELDEWMRDGGEADYITLSGSGEPTLHSEFGRVIDFVNSRDSIKMAVLSNGSLFWIPDVRNQASHASLVKVSLSAWDQASFERMNKPCCGLCFDSVLEGLQLFGQEFAGELWVEVFVVSGINGDADSLEKIAGLVKTVKPDKIQLNTVVRPPAQPSANPVSFDFLKKSVALFGPDAEVIFPFSAESLKNTGNDEACISAVLARHPCRFEEVSMLFGHDIKKAEKVLGAMLAKKMVRLEKHGEDFFYISGDSTSVQRDPAGG